MSILHFALLPLHSKLTCDSGTDPAKRYINANTLWTILVLFLVPLHEVGQEGLVIDWPGGETPVAFPILPASIVDNANHAALHGMDCKSCPKGEIPA